MIVQPTNGGRFISAKRLPDGYQEVEWIAGTGTQYINTDYQLNGGCTIDIDFKFDVLPSTGTGICGSYGGMANRFELLFYRPSSQMEPGYYSKYLQTGQRFEIGTERLLCRFDNKVA